MEFLQNDSKYPAQDTRQIYKKRSKTHSFTALSRNLMIEKTVGTYGSNGFLASCASLGGDKRDRTADLLNAILSPAHFSRKTGRKRPVFSGFLPPFREAVWGNSTRIPLFLGGLLGVRMAGDLPPSPGAGRRARPCVLRLCAPKGVKKSWENPGNAASRQ